ncbi:hypothetical protein FJY63_08220, partial [Candidatus Sumerlaeota bacterium]|nr:hypothetical protein [Candidatus Sumerlaeota bacterium]
MSPRTHLFAWIVCAILYGPMLSPGSWASAADQTPGREGRGQLLGASGAEMFSRLGTGAMRQAIADGMAKQYAVATVSIADYFPLNDGDYQLFADGTSYSIQGTFTFHGYVAFRRNIH